MTQRKPYMPLYGDDWRTGTEDVPSEFRGAYLDLCWIIFDQGGEVPNIPTALARHARLSKRKFERFWASCKHKFLVSDIAVRHQKIDAILESLAKVSAKRKKSGAKGGQKTQRNQRRLSSGAKAIQTKGLVSSLQEEIPNRYGNQNQDIKENEGSTAAPSATARESGGGLVAASGRRITLRERLGEDGYSVWRDLRDDLTRGHRLSNSDVDQVAKVLVGFDGSAFTITEQPYDGHRWDAVQEIASVEGLSIIERKSHSLRVVAGANQTVGSKQ